MNLTPVLLAGLLMTGCASATIGGPSSQSADCLIDGLTTWPVGTAWQEASFAAVDGWTRPAPAGPWDFEALGSPFMTETRTVVAVGDAPHNQQFPPDSYVIQSENSGAAVARLYRFYLVGTDGLYWLGDSDPLLAVTVDPPQKFLPSTMRVGQRWEQQYRDSRYDVLVSTDHEVIGCGEARVPAGRYSNSLLLRSTYRYSESPSSSTVLTWHVTGVGMVAAAVFSGGDDLTSISVLTEFRPTAR
ncbi:MAG: hypothetical protein U0556_09630 [Dehalococcoidia bacterium]|nr:hypothetical protein [Thermomicrobiales bacterium]